MGSDPFNMPADAMSPMRIHALSVDITPLGGEVVYERCEGADHRPHCRVGSL